MPQVEDWSEGDFDLDHTALRTDKTSLQDVHAQHDSHFDVDAQNDWDADYPDDDVDETSDEETDTIKLSTAASSALKLMLEANKASSSATSSHASAIHNNLEGQPHPPALELVRISQYVTADFGLALGSDAEECSTASLSASASTSGRSLMGLSTDLTDPDSPRSKQNVQQASSNSSRSSDHARSDLDNPLYDFGDTIELDFDLAPDMNNLSLCSSLSRARSNTSLSHASRDVWDDDFAPLSGTTNSSSSSLQPPGFPDLPPSAKSLSGESDADDEHEDILDGLDFEGSVFETQAGRSSPSAPGLKTKLEAILNLKRSGQPSDAKAHQATDSDTGLAAGLVIDDDFDFSPSRIAARGLSSRFYSPVTTFDSASVLGIGPSTPHGDERCHPGRSASHPTATVHASTLTTRSEVRGASRNHLQVKRSTSDLHAHASAAAAPSTTSSMFRRPSKRSGQLTRKRSLPSVRTLPPASSPSAAAPSTAAPSHVNARAPSARQRYNSGNADASSNWRSRSNVTSRLTDSTAASRARAAETAADQLARLQRDAIAPARPSTPVSFQSRSTHQAASRITVKTRSKAKSNLERRTSFGDSQPVARLLTRSDTYGNGAELDGIDDLPSSVSAVQSTRQPLANKKFSQAPSIPNSIPGKKQRQRGNSRAKGGKPALIRPLGAGGTPAQKTVKGMRWNSQALRWEGNEDVLRDFDQIIQRSTRPALISQLTGSSTGSALAHVAGYSSPLSPESNNLLNSISSGARVVGDMLFDPVQMRWVQKSGDEEDDVFAEFDDPLGEGSFDAPASKLGVDGDSTLRARRTRSTEAFSRSSNPWTRRTGKHGATQDIDQVIRQALSRGAFAPNVGIDREFWDACVQAEKRHAIEVNGLLPQSTGPHLRSRSQPSDRMTIDEIDRPRPHLYYLESIAKSIIKPDSRS